MWWEGASLRHPLQRPVRIAVIAGLVLSALTYWHPEPGLPVAVALLLMVLAVAVGVVGAAIWLAGRYAVPRDRRRAVRPLRRAQRVGATVATAAYAVFMTGGVMIVVISVVRLFATAPWAQ